MAVSLSVIAAKDSAGTAIAGGLQAQDKSGAGTGPFTLGQVLIDGVAGVNMAAVTAANAVKVDGSAVTQPVSLTSTTITGTVAATQSGTWTVQPGNTANTTAWKVDGSAVTQPVSIATAPVLVAGAAIIGKVGIDQTTPGTTNLVALTAETTKVIGVAKIGDGTNTAAVKAASTAPAATDPAMVVAISPNSVNANGLAAAGSSAPVVIAPQTLDVVVTPTVTASAYTANNIIGGIMTFANILPTVGTNGVLQSITAKFKATAVTGNITVAIFKASPSNGTYADKTAGTYNSADMANLIGTYQLTTPLALGAYTMTVYCLDAIGKAFVGSSTSLYAIATVAGTPTPASTSDFSLELSVLPG